MNAAQQTDVNITQVTNLLIQAIETLKKSQTQTLKRKRRPYFLFKELGIPIGAKLRCVYDRRTLVQVGMNDNVWYKGKRMSITAATRKVAAVFRSGYKSSPLYTDCWTYNGELLSSIVKRTYG